MSKRESQLAGKSVEGCRQDAPSGSRIRNRRQLASWSRANLSTNSHPPSTNLIMLRLTVLAARPLGKSAAVTLRPVARNFSSLGSKTTTNTFKDASIRSRVSPSSFWSKCSRTFMTDSSTVTARPTQAEAWKKYAVTAVGFCIVFLNDPTRSVHRTPVCV